MNLSQGCRYNEKKYNEYDEYNAVWRKKSKKTNASVKSMTLCMKLSKIKY